MNRAKKQRGSRSKGKEVKSRIRKIESWRGRKGWAEIEKEVKRNKGIVGEIKVNNNARNGEEKNFGWVKKKN